MGRFLVPREIDVAHDALQVDGCLDVLEVRGEVNVGMQRARLVECPDLLAVVGRRELDWVKSGHFEDRAASKTHVRADPGGGSPSDKQEGEWATVRLLLPRPGYAPQQKSGP